MSEVCSGHLAAEVAGSCGMVAQLRVAINLLIILGVHGKKSKGIRVARKFLEVMITGAVRRGNNSQKDSFLLCHFVLLRRAAAGQGLFPPLSPRGKLDCWPEGPLSPRLFWNSR